MTLTFSVRCHERRGGPKLSWPHASTNSSVHRCLIDSAQLSIRTNACDVTTKTDDVTPVRHLSTSKWRHGRCANRWLTEILLSFCQTETGAKTDFTAHISKWGLIFLSESVKEKLVVWSEERFNSFVCKTSHISMVCFLMSPNLIIDIIRKGRIGTFGPWLL